MNIDGSIPLNRLPIVVIDLETTGLNVATDRIVQLGGVTMKGGRILEETYNRLVNPGITIDSKIADIHGITNEKVVEKPSYGELHIDFHKFIQDRIVVGFNVGFDLAMLRNETERLKLKPLHYRFLDVRFLGLVLSLSPELLYLESLADSFSLKSENRHDALGDSILTAKILSKFIPLLRAKGVNTLGEAERCCQEKMSFLSVSYSSDWYYPSPPEGNIIPIKEQVWDQLERIDPFPFSHTVGEVMGKGILSISEEKTLNEAIQVMGDHNIGSILVHTKNNSENIIGIFTERDLLKNFAQASKGSEKYQQSMSFNSLGDKPIRDLMKYPIHSISENAFIFQAIQTMVVERTRHLLVTGDEGHPVGVISQRDFLKTRMENFYSNQKQIEKLKTVPELADLHAEIPVLARRLMKEELRADKITQVVSSECNIIVKKGCELALEKIKGEKGPPPCSFAVLVLGSAGRGESLLAFDQDNAIIYETDHPDHQIWFLSFGKELNDILNAAGIPLCKGGVMAGNKKWCRSLKSWKEQLKEWFTSSHPEAILYADIFVDFIHVYGNDILSHRLHKELTAIGQTQKTFLKLMGEEIINKTSSPITLFGGIKTDNGKIDLKATVLFPIVATARLLALKIGYGKSNSTHLRYKAALNKLKLNDYEVEIIKETHRLSLSLILEQQLNRISLGEKPNNMVFIKTFPKRKVERFRELLSYLEGLKTMIQNAITQ